MLRASATVLVAVAATIGLCEPATSANDRFALVIGNSKYQAVTPLPNPSRDAEAFSMFLKLAGFDVTTAVDLDQVGMRRAVGEFAEKVTGKPEDSVALIYYAGHGVQVDGENYLVPVDARIKSEADVALQAVRFRDIMNSLERIRGKTRMVFLDACRNNPFNDGKAPHGLAMVDAPAGTLVAYSTSPGAEAEDGTGSNSPFTTALIATGRTPGLPIESALKDVRLAVHRETTGRQVPWEVSSLIQSFSFFPGAMTAAPTPVKVAATPSQDKPPARQSEDKSAGAPIKEIGKDKTVVVATGRDQAKDRITTAPTPGTAVAAASQNTAVAMASADPSAVVRQEKSAVEWRNELRPKTEDEALDIAIREDRVVVYRVVIELFPRAIYIVRLRALLDRRIQMWDWFDAVSFDTVEGYVAFINLYPDSDLAFTARRLLQRAKLRSLTSSTSPGALGLASALGPSAPAPAQSTQPQTIIKEVPVVKTVIREVPVIKEVIRTKIETKVVQVPAPCRCSGGDRPTGLRITPGVGVGRGGNYKPPMSSGGFNRGGFSRH